MKKEEIDIEKNQINSELNDIDMSSHLTPERFNNLLKRIHNYKYQDRIKFRSEYDKINEVAFKKGIKLDGYRPEEYFEKKRAKSSKSSEDWNKSIFSRIDLLHKCAETRFRFFSRHAFLKLSAEGKKNHSILLIHNHDSLPAILQVVKREIDQKTENPCRLFSMADFLKGLKEGDLRDQSYLVFFTFIVRTDPQVYVDEVFNELSGYFNVTQLKFGDYPNGFKEYTDIESIKTEIQYIMMIDLVNMELDSHELKAIKLLFGANRPNQIHYRINTKGFSGSKVLSVQPFKFIENPQKYIVKISDRSNEKLLKEEKNFKEYVETYDINYNILVTKTEECIAIRYHYATSDSNIKSSSFGDILREKKNDVYTLDDKKKYITKLFETNLYTRWNNSNNSSIISYSNYLDYINEDEIKKQLSKIYDTNDVNDLEIISIFNKIKKIKLEGKTQLCHGDLHTENFFVDEVGNLFFIDFGDVGYHHNIIDYAMLETSIKLNHMPKYIPNEKLFDLEMELLNEDTFNSNYKFASQKRADLLELYSLITHVREITINNISNKNEYYYSLFMLTFRQIRYPNLNQLYAIQVAEAIGKKLIKDI